MPEADEFDFLEGEWDAVCRFPYPDGSWGEGPGTLKATKVLDNRKGLDTSSPGGFQVWRGRFEEGKIDLFGEWDDSGHRVLSRLTWSAMTGSRAHWESHRSLDGGATWTKHWVIDFARRPARG